MAIFSYFYGGKYIQIMQWKPIFSQIAKVLILNQKFLKEDITFRFPEKTTKIWSYLHFRFDVTSNVKTKWKIVYKALKNRKDRNLFWDAHQKSFKT